MTCTSSSCHIARQVKELGEKKNRLSHPGWRYHLYLFLASYTAIINALLSKCFASIFMFFFFNQQNWWRMFRRWLQLHTIQPLLLGNQGLVQPQVQVWPLVEHIHYWRCWWRQNVMIIYIYLISSMLSNSVHHQVATQSSRSISSKEMPNSLKNALYLNA